MSREKNVFEKFPKKWPKGPFGKPVRGKRRNHGLPSGVKGGENMDVADSYKRMSGNGREKKTGSL